MRLWERNHKDSLDFGRGFARISKTLGEDLQRLARICQTLREYLQGFARLWERIREDLQDS